MHFEDGQCVDSIPLTDRGYQFGDGFFETISIINGNAYLLDKHLDRLYSTSDILQFRLPSRDEVRLQIQTILTEFPQKRAVLKINISRKASSRGYAIPKDNNSRLIFSLYEFSKNIDNYRKQGINLYQCKTVLGHNPSLAGLKHTNRLEQVIASSEFNFAEYQEGLMFDIDGLAIEGCKSNLFIVKNRTLITPNLDNCGIAGIMRAHLIELATKLKFCVRIDSVSLQDVLSADEIFVCNSIIKIWPVIQFAGCNYKIGAITQRLMNDLPRELFAQVEN